MSVRALVVFEGMTRRAARAQGICRRTPAAASPRDRFQRAPRGAGSPRPLGAHLCFDEAVEGGRMHEVALDLVTPPAHPLKPCPVIGRLGMLRLARRRRRAPEPGVVSHQLQRLVVVAGSDARRSRRGCATVGFQNSRVRQKRVVPGGPGPWPTRAGCRGRCSPRGRGCRRLQRQHDVVVATGRRSDSISRRSLLAVSASIRAGRAATHSSPRLDRVDDDLGVRGDDELRLLVRPRPGAARRRSRPAGSRAGGRRARRAAARSPAAC